MRQITLGISVNVAQCEEKSLLIARELSRDYTFTIRENEKELNKLDDIINELRKEIEDLQNE